MYSNVLIFHEMLNHTEWLGVSNPLTTAFFYKYPRITTESEIFYSLLLQNWAHNKIGTFAQEFSVNTGQSICLFLEQTFHHNFNKSPSC